MAGGSPVIGYRYGRIYLYWSSIAPYQTCLGCHAPRSGGPVQWKQCSRAEYMGDSIESIFSAFVEAPPDSNDLRMAKLCQACGNTPRSVLPCSTAPCGIYARTHARGRPRLRAASRQTSSESTAGRGEMSIQANVIVVGLEHRFCAVACIAPRMLRVAATRHPAQSRLSIMIMVIITTII